MTLTIPNHVANGLDADGDQLEQNFNSIKQWGNAEVITSDGATAMVAPLLLPAAMPTQPNQAASKAYVDSGVPVSTMVMFAGDTAPEAWMFCRGQSISRATYAALFAAIGVRFGSADGSTFNLPNLQGTLPVGHNSGVNPPAGLAGKFVAGVGERGGSTDTTLVVHAHSQTAHAHSIPAHGHTATVTPSRAVLNMYDITNAGGWPTTGSAGILFGATGSRLPVDQPSLWINNGSTQLAAAVANTAELYTDRTDAVNTGANGVAGTNQNLQPYLTVNYVIKVQ